jgi:uncharacterized phage protein (TIGR02218 family)
VRSVPVELQQHLDQAATTTTRLLKVRLTNGITYGLSMLDRDIVYDDGDGEVTYVATNGFDSTTFSADTGYAVANAEGYALISNEIEGIELDDVERGVLDDAQWVCYLVNFDDLTRGRHILLDAGDLGEVRVRHGLVWLPELLSYIARLKQPVGHVWSRTCRAIFGTPANSQTGCGIPLATLWVEGEVTVVGGETNRVFTGDVVSEESPGPPLVPGRVQFLTGDNAGREYATEERDGLTITLAEPTIYPIEVGDTYRIRPDCGKRYEEDCIATWNNGINFKGEPHIPVGDASQVQTPGAQLGAGWQFRNALEGEGEGGSG